MRIDESAFGIIKMIESKYPKMDITQLGMIVLMLGGLRVTLGHNNSGGTLRDYCHVIIDGNASKNIIKCIDFLEREVFALTKSKLDIDTYKTGNKTVILSDSKYPGSDKKSEDK